MCYIYAPIWIQFPMTFASFDRHLDWWFIGVYVCVCVSTDISNVFELTIFNTNRNCIGNTVLLTFYTKTNLNKSISNEKRLFNTNFRKIEIFDSLRVEEIAFWANLGSVRSDWTQFTVPGLQFERKRPYAYFTTHKPECKTQFWMSDGIFEYITTPICVMSFVTHMQPLWCCVCQTVVYTAN